MKAEIKKETNDGYGLLVIDNNSVEHKIGVCYDGKIDGHLQDGYPDHPPDRTPSQNEHVNQARRYAKWHVYRERGYDTLPSYENPDQIVGAMAALAALSEDTVEKRFSDLQAQLRSHFDGSTVELPFEDAAPDDLILYRQDIYVRPDPTEAEPPLVKQFDEFFASPQETLQKILGEDSSSLERLVDVLDADVEPAEQFPHFEIEAVSGLHYLHKQDGTDRTHWGDDPLDRDPDARIELLPVQADVFDSFQQFLLSHLGNQVRDYYLLMGCEPPAAFQQGGLGCYEGLKKQQILEMYDRHFVGETELEEWGSQNALF